MADEFDDGMVHILRESFRNLVARIRQKPKELPMLVTVLGGTYEEQAAGKPGVRHPPWISATGPPMEYRSGANESGVATAVDVGLAPPAGKAWVLLAIRAFYSGAVTGVMSADVEENTVGGLTGYSIIGRLFSIGVGSTPLNWPSLTDATSPTVNYAAWPPHGVLILSSASQRLRLQAAAVAAQTSTFIVSVFEFDEAAFIITGQGSDLSFPAVS